MFLEASTAKSRRSLPATRRLKLHVILLAKGPSVDLMVSVCVSTMDQDSSSGIGLFRKSKGMTTGPGKCIKAKQNSRSLVPKS